MKRVLVVDDEENLRVVLRTLLRRHSYEVETAGSGEEALALVESFGPDFVLTDVRMPRMGGLDLLATLRAKGNEATVVVMSAYGNMDMAIAIRTMVMKDGIAYVQAGGGLVYDSVPEREYEETMNKARALLKAISQAEESRLI